jgi:hypothetical protein
LGIFKNLPQHASIHPAFRLTLASFTENYLLGPTPFLLTISHG